MSAASPRTEYDDDLAHGAIVIIAARWVLAASGLVLALWNPSGLAQLQVAIVLILALAIGNFALHMQIVTRGPLVARVVYAASAADLVIISTLIVVSGGYPSEAYVFYLPALLAISVTFRTPIAALYTGAAIVAYAAIAAAEIVPGAEADTIADEAIAPLTELLMLAGVAVCGNVYWRLERQRRGVRPPERRQQPQPVVTRESGEPEALPAG